MKFRFKPFKGDKTSSEDASPGSPQNPQARRKDQIRRAQKTHRERKEAYTKGLENEVVQLRANEARIMQETKALYSEINMLKNTLRQNGIPVPTVGHQGAPATVIGEALGMPLSSLSIQNARSRTEHQRITIQKNVANVSERRQGPATTVEDVQVALARMAPNSNFSQPFTLPTEALSSNQLDLSQTMIASLDATAVGMDFVLTLESPCLSHNIPSTHDATTGHALTVSATLLHHHPSPPEHRLASSQNHQTAWQIPTLGIERLLQLSENVPLFEGELTPVQAWDKVRKHPEFGTLESERMEKLKALLLKGVKCYGFGGVIDDVTFENALFDVFVVGRVF